MDRLSAKAKHLQLRKNRIRSVIHGTKDHPRLSIHISLNHVQAQIIDDDSSTTLAYASSVGSKSTGTLTAKAAAVGTEIAKKALNKKIKRVVFDRGSKLYHGRVKALADAAREQGLEF
jgi:large subunit ribosomal protein L18